MDLQEIETLIKLLQNSDLNELEITKEGEGSLRISRGGSMVSVAHQPMTYHHQPQQQNISSAQPTAPAVETGHTVKSPMVGTFYRKPSPDAAPFVEVGNTVRAGQTLCVIEAMKLLNQIESPRDGKITKILVEDGEAIEFDQTLFIIE